MQSKNTQAVQAKYKSQIEDAKMKQIKRRIRVRLTLVEDALGMSPADPAIVSEYIASKAPDARSMEEEIAAIGTEEVEKKGMTIFPKLNAEDEKAGIGSAGTPFVYDYQIKGGFKDKCGMLARVGKTGANDDEKATSKNAPTISGRLSAYKAKINSLVFIMERKIPITMPEGQTFGNLQRPLRAETAQGPRVALANSETVPAGSTLKFTVGLIDPAMYDAVVEWLEYGIFSGLGQWRNAGWGAYVVDIVADVDEVGRPYMKRKRGAK